MQSGNLKIGGIRFAGAQKLAGVIVLLTGSMVSPAFAQQEGQKTFTSPEEASKALYMAAQANDEQALTDLLGAKGRALVSSGDATEDAQNRANFVKRYEEMNRLVKEPDGTVALYVGPHNWPLPIPLANKGNVWYFDTEAGQQEILFRRIGKNEISAIHVCIQLAMAQKEYYAQHDNQYAQKIMSDEGKDDGLYWKPGENQPKSPIGPLVAHAVSTQESSGTPVPFRGYYFHCLQKQGKSAPGGAKTYIVDGKMTGGFAFIAYPAEYRSSGVKSFLVSVDGVVYEKDLGDKTESIAKAMTEFNLGSGWEKAQLEPKTTAAAK